MNHFSGRNYLISSTLSESIIWTLVGDARWLEWHWSHRGRMYDAEFSPIHNLGIITHPLWGPHPSCVLFTSHLYIVWCWVYNDGIWLEIPNVNLCHSRFGIYIALSALLMLKFPNFPPPLLQCLCIRSRCGYWICTKFDIIVQPFVSTKCLPQHRPP